MRRAHEGLSGRLGRVRGVEVVRHYGDPAGEFESAVETVAVRDRSHRARLVLTGSDPVGMISGLVTGHVPARLELVEPDVWGGRAEPSAALTPKGRVISTLRLWRWQVVDADRVSLEVPRAGAAGLVAHLASHLPPRLARVEDRSERTGMLTLLGPQAAELLSRLAAGLRVEVDALSAMNEGGLRRVEVGGGEGVLLIRSGTVAAPAWDVCADLATVEALWRGMLEAGATPMGADAWEVLRLEAGRPAFGTEVTESSLLPETGLDGWLVDDAKGCYTGQEVVVRVRDRGRVNRHLRRLFLGDAPPPDAGSELFLESGSDAVGRITSAARSPRRGTLALAYVRREVEVPAELRVGGPDGAKAVARELAIPSR